MRLARLACVSSIYLGSSARMFATQNTCAVLFCAGQCAVKECALVAMATCWLHSLDCNRMRWTVRGTPRVPWDAVGIFDGVSTFRLDKDGKIYEHQARTCVRGAVPLDHPRPAVCIPGPPATRNIWLGEQI